MDKVDILIKNANEIITLQGKPEPRTGDEMNELSIVKHGCVAIKDDSIVDIGQDISVDAEMVIDAKGKIVLPGFVDPHTHVVFGGTREFELDWKLHGLSYMQIKKKGGGIQYTVDHTRNASSDELYAQSLSRLKTMFQHGTTTCEAKSGYGLDTENELRILDVQNRLNQDHPMDVVSTFLGAHAVPKEHMVDEYVDLVINEMIPAVKGKAVFCDVFCEKGFFNYEQSKQILHAGKDHGLIPKVHADELNDMNGGVLAMEVGAISADHLLHINTDSMKMMAKHEIVGVMLPGTPFCLMMKEYAPARAMIDTGMPLALATDLNPNCYVENMQFMIQLACFNMHMTPAEAITAATYNAACAINKQEIIGSLEIGKKADMVIMPLENHMMIPYHFGVNHVETVIKNGHVTSVQ